MAKVSATVEVVRQREKNYSVRLSDGEWYGGLGKADIGEGDLVEVEWVQQGQFKNLTQIGIINKADDQASEEVSPTGKYTALIDHCAQVMAYCKKATDEIFGDDPKYKDIGTHCNSMFIEVCRMYRESSRGGLK